MKKIATAIFAIVLLSSCNGQKTTTNNIASLNTTIDSVSYAVGMSIGKNLKDQGVDSLNTAIMMQAINDIFKGNKPIVDEQQSMQTINNYFRILQMKKSEAGIKEGKDFLDANAKKQGVVTLPSGLQYMVIKEGTGAQPAITDMVTTHYHGTFIDGKVFDSSVERGEPATFPVNGVIAGWTEALQLMKVGAKWKLFVPYNLAYGERGTRGIAPFSTLIFEVELLKVEKK